MKFGSPLSVFALVVILTYMIFILQMLNSTSLQAAKEKLVVNDKKIADLMNEIQAKEYEVKSLREKMESVSSCSKQLMNTSAVRPGVIVLGMHRSGTSIVGGLLNKMGLNVGGNLIGAAEDNSKGFFERTDVVLQNDWLFRKQNVHYSVETYRYDALQGLKDVFNDDGTVIINVLAGREGKQALEFFNNPSSYPWMMKDPRLCITIRTWLPQLNFIPAVLFTYRHPLDVALSMHKRESEQFAIQRALKMW